MARVGDLSHLSGSERLDNDAASVRNASVVLSSQRLYWIQPVDQLPRVDLSATLLSRLLCPHGSAAERRACYARVLSFVDRWLLKLQLLMLLGCPMIVAMFFVRDPAAQAATSIVAFCVSMPLLTLAFATLSYDMTTLVVRTFEFWFLTAVNVVNTIVFFSLFRDLRVVGIVGSSLFYQLTLFTDANLHTRLVELRFLVFGSPAMVIVVLACILHITPHLHYSAFSCLGVSVANVDLLLNGNFIIAFFTMRKTHRNRHLLSATHAGERHIVQCQMYFPTCRLVACDGRTVDRLRVRTASENNVFTRRKTKAHGTVIDYEQTLHLVPSGVADAVDVERVVVPGTIRGLVGAENRVVRWTSNAVAVLGILCATLAHAQSILRLDVPLVSSSKSHSLALAIVGLTATLITTGWYMANCQRDLLRLLVNEVDAWFATVHFTMVAICVADIVHWRHDALPVLCAWLWSMWVVLLDALPPVARRRLGFQRWLLLLVNVLLMLFHVSLLYALFFSPSDAHLNNRVLIDLTVSVFRLRLEMFSFVTSKIFTSFVWMGRFLWRESVRPRDAFKVVKHRVQFLIPSSGAQLDTGQQTGNEIS